jgi:NAD(P)H dehydrogenase (quinone)
MHALIVVSNPNPTSFSAAVAARLRDGLVSAGHTVEIADLAAEGFDPRMSHTDLEYFWGREPVPADVRREQERVDRADALFLIWPLYWWQMPALMKGWIDRVFQMSWAYGYTADGVLTGLLRDRPVHAIVHGETDAPGADKRGYRNAILTLVDGIFGFCGMKRHQTTFLFEVLSEDAKIREAHLETVYGIGQSALAEEAAASPQLAGA